MLRKYKHLAVAFIVTVISIVAVICLPHSRAAIVLILVFCSLSVLVLQSLSRSTQRSRSDYAGLLAKMETVEVLLQDMSAVEIKKFGENEARLRQVATLVKQIELSTRRLADVRESEEAATSERVTSEAQERASVEFKFRLLEDLADVRDVVHDLKLDAYNRQNQES